MADEPAPDSVPADEWTAEEIDARANDLPPDIPALPGVDPNVSQDPNLYDVEQLTAAAVAPGTAAAMISVARGLLGTVEHPDGSNNAPPVTTEYGLTGPWCDMGITYEGKHSGNAAVVGHFALTTAHAAWFKARGQFHYGAAGMRAGDVPFYSWSRGKTIGSIEHVELCEKDLGGGRWSTIGCNVGNACRRETRDATYIVGYGRPAYASTTQEDVLKTVVDLGAAKEQIIKAHSRGSIDFEIEYQDPDHIHTDADKDGRYPSIFPTGGDAAYAVTGELLLGQRPSAGAFLMVASYDRKSGEFERDIRGIEIVGDRVVLHSNIRMSDQHRYRLDVNNTSAADVVVQRAYMLVAR